jgi:hypothetical protein
MADSTGGAGAVTYTYLWSSTTSAVVGFGNASGTNNAIGYTLEQQLSK